VWPTITDAGLNVDGGLTLGLYAPANTPAAIMTHGVTRCVIYAMLRSVRRRSAPDYSRLDANKETQSRERETRRCTQLSATQAKIDRDGGPGDQ